MFLNQLKPEEKELFLELSANAVMANGEFDQDELETVAKLCYEMMMPNHLPDTNKPLDVILEEINEMATVQERNIIVFELFTLLGSDENHDSKEMDYMDYVAYKLEVNDDKYQHLRSLSRLRELLNKELNTAICR